MESDISEVRRALEAFASEIPDTRRIALVSVGGTKAAVLQIHTADRNRLTEAIARLPSLTWMALSRRYHETPWGYPVGEGLRLAVSGLTEDSPEGGTVLLLATEVWIRRSGLSDADFRTARDGGVRLDAILVRRDLRPEMVALPPDLGVAMTDLFERGTGATGGQMEAVASARGLTRTLRSLAQELRNRYAIEFSSGTSARDIKVEVGVHLRARVRTTRGR